MIAGLRSLCLQISERRLRLFLVAFAVAEGAALAGKTGGEAFRSPPLSDRLLNESFEDFDDDV
jgi:hypothetical protein